MKKIANFLDIYGKVVCSAGMEAGETENHATVTEVDISDEMPNGDDSAFTEDSQQPNESNSTPRHTTSIQVDLDRSNDDQAEDSPDTAEQVFVATSQGLLAAVTPDQLHEAGIKTTHIVIHDQSTGSIQLEHGLRTPSTPIPPPTPSTPLSRERGYKYQWDDSVHLPVLPVRCKNSNGELHKSRFGSGNFEFIYLHCSLPC